MYVWFACILKALSVFTGGFVSGILAGAVGSQMSEFGGDLQMPLETRTPGILRFGTFEVDVRAGELRKQGVRIKLQEQPFHVLTVLLQRPGEVVTREELRSQN